MTSEQEIIEELRQQLQTLEEKYRALLVQLHTAQEKEKAESALFYWPWAQVRGFKDIVRVLKQKFLS